MESANESTEPAPLSQFQPHPGSGWGCQPYTPFPADAGFVAFPRKSRRSQGPAEAPVARACAQCWLVLRTPELNHQLRGIRIRMHIANQSTRQELDNRHPVLACIITINAHNFHIFVFAAKLTLGSYEQSRTEKGKNLPFEENELPGLCVRPSGNNFLSQAATRTSKNDDAPSYTVCSNSEMKVREGLG